MVSIANKAPTTYLISVLFGYIIAIIVTTIVMIVFDHPQPALLYLVPGCILSVFSVALAKGEFSQMWSFEEDTYLKIKEE